jgi:BirA family biotin operon repressor/biotin-[acetyl-CoA-carboxylase] ligase
VNPEKWLKSGMPLIDPVRIKALLGPLAGRFDVDALAEVDSSNSELSRRADAGAPGGSVLVADMQTAGRGRRGRTWLSAPEDSLTFSVLWRFSMPAGRMSGLSLAVGLALARALGRLGAKGVSLKWPNDVLLAANGEFAKLAGILIELSSDRRGSAAIIGIGLNLQPPDVVLPQPVAGLAQAMSVTPERHLLLAAILEELFAVFEAFSAGGFAALREDWQAVHAWQDQPVRIVDELAPEITGICRGVDADGSLLLETAAGMRCIHAGDVSLRRP